MLVDYNYYTNTFKGDLVPQDKFDKLSQISESEVMASILGKDYTGFETNVKNAICEIIEVFYNQELIKEKYIGTITGSESVITSEKVGDYSRNFGNASSKDLQDILKKEEQEANIKIGDILRRNLLLTGLLYCGIRYV